MEAGNMYGIDQRIKIVQGFADVQNTIYLSENLCNETI